MDNLIPIEINENQEPIVSGRMLHEFLEVKTEYKDWFPRMVAYGFDENIDYLLVAQKRATNNPKNPLTEFTDHAIKLDMAKEISMLQRNKQGKEARQYFIQVEKDFNSPEKIMARALVLADKTINNLTIDNKFKEKRIKELKPKADYTDQVLQSKSLVCVNQIAKDYGMSAQKMNKILYDIKIQYKMSGQWLLYAKYQDKGYVHSTTVKVPRTDGTTDIKMNTHWTQKGREFLYEKLKEINILPVIAEEVLV